VLRRLLHVTAEQSEGREQRDDVSETREGLLDMVEGQTTVEKLPGLGRERLRTRHLKALCREKRKRCGPDALCHGAICYQVLYMSMVTERKVERK
jgi:hypothetical protein